MPPARDRATAQFDSCRLTLGLRAIDKLEIVGASRVEVNPPLPGEPVHRTFDVRAVAVGDAELWVMVRQGVLPAITFKLTPTVVESVPPEQCPRSPLPPRPRRRTPTGARSSTS
jgi:hypothetical protein